MCACVCVLIFARGVLYLLHGACKGESLGAVPFLNLQRRFAKFDFFIYLFFLSYGTKLKCSFSKWFPSLIRIVLLTI